MDSSPPYPIGPGQRMLAAIVFTDVVNFTRRMHEEEEGTLRLLEQDFEEMRQVGEKHAGTVLKTTGDGLLLYFTSALQAARFAIKIQQKFAQRKQSTPPDGSLVHRVGIHLGEVFVVEQDVMGDGVNIAARLQQEAEPGGICMSQTVYDVVKNKLEMNVVRLMPRNLKNISESVPIYRVVLEPAVVRPAPVYVPPPVPPPARLSRAQKLALGGGLLVILAGAAGWLLQAERRHEEELAHSRATQVELGALLKAKGGDPLGPAPTRAGPAEVVPGAPPDASIRVLLEWVNRTLARYTADNPLLLRALPGAGSRNTKIFLDAEHRLCFAEGGAIRQRNFADLKPDALGAVIASVLLDATQPPPPEVAQGAEAFAQLHGLREMAEALHAGAGPVPPRS